MNTTQLRRAAVRKAHDDEPVWAGEWVVELYHEGLALGPFGWPSFDAALAAALRWVHLA